jgi:hypothetical protein
VALLSVQHAVCVVTCDIRARLLAILAELQQTAIFWVGFRSLLYESLSITPKA